MSDETRDLVLALSAALADAATSLDVSGIREALHGVEAAAADLVELIGERNKAEQQEREREPEESQALREAIEALRRLQAPPAAEAPQVSVNVQPTPIEVVVQAPTIPPTPQPEAPIVQVLAPLARGWSFQFKYDERTGVLNGATAMRIE